MYKSTNDITSLHKVFPVYNDKTIYLKSGQMRATFQYIQWKYDKKSTFHNFSAMFLDILIVIWKTLLLELLFLSYFWFFHSSMTRQVSLPDKQRTQISTLCVSLKRRYSTFSEKAELLFNLNIFTVEQVYISEQIQDILLSWICRRFILISWISAPTSAFSYDISENLICLPQVVSGSWYWRNAL